MQKFSVKPFSKGLRFPKAASLVALRRARNLSAQSQKYRQIFLMQAASANFPLSIPEGAPKGVEWTCSFGRKDSVKGNHQGFLSRLINTDFARRAKSAAAGRSTDAPCKRGLPLSFPFSKLSFRRTGEKSIGGASLCQPSQKAFFLHR